MATQQEAPRLADEDQQLVRDAIQVLSDPHLFGPDDVESAHAVAVSFMEQMLKRLKQRMH